MEESKEIKVKLSSVIIIVLLIAICVLSFLFFRMNNDYKTIQEEYANFLFSKNEESNVVENTVKEEITEETTTEPNLDTILDKIYIAPKFVMASDEYKKQLFASCSNTTALVNQDGKLEVTVGKDKFVVEEIEEEIIDIKLGIVNQHDGKNDINTSFVRDVFVLTKFGDVYAVNITYGYNPNLISKILTDVVKLENVERKGLYDNDSGYWDSVVIAKKSDNTIAICDDGERDGL